jgi:hypothetical protein
MYETDFWMFQEKLMPEDEPNDMVERFTERLIASANYIKEISKQADVCLRYYLQSDYAQIYFDFSPSITRKLADLNVRMEFSILSWGGVKKE